MDQRTNYGSGTQWERLVGYSRAVKMGNVIEVSGTVAVDEWGAVVGRGDVYSQTKFILQKIEAVLVDAGASMRHVVRTRMFIVDISQWPKAGRAHGETFATIRPCTSLIEVKRLIHPDYLIEIEATAILPNV